jgi:hypothetical protein
MRPDRVEVVLVGLAAVAPHWIIRPIGSAFLVVRQSAVGWSREPAKRSSVAD